jgi:hypothetical protein
MDNVTLMRCVVFLVLYFVPTYVARGGRYYLPIFLLNLLLGWTFVAWVGALIWAVIEKQKRAR